MTKTGSKEQHTVPERLAKQFYPPKKKKKKTPF